MKTYGELKTQIADWLDREDLTGRIPEFIRLAETKIYRGLRCRENEFTYRIDADLDSDPPVDPYGPIDLPDNYREMKLVVVNDRFLECISDQEYYHRERNYSRENSPDDAQFYTILARQLYIHPWPKITPDDWDATSVVIHYYGTESLGDMAVWGTPTNPVEDPAVEGTASYNEQSDQNTTRLFQTSPDLYLAGAMMEACLYLKDEQRLQFWEQKFSQSLTQLRTEHRRANFAGSTVAVANSYQHNRKWGR